MGESPIFACKAHVFQLEPESKKSWLPLSTNAVNVQLFHDPIKNVYRVVSVEGTKALINSIITPKMTFTKTSQKFGQWIDFKMNVVYGLGFANDVELNKFVDKFKEIKDLTRNSVRSMNPHERSSSVEIGQINRAEIKTENQYDSIEAQLKYENDRLKLALAQSSANARKWEEELQILKNNNARLTTALQESHSNVEEWKKQLQFYKDECLRLRNLTSAMNSNATLSTLRIANDDANGGVTRSPHGSQDNSREMRHDLDKITDLFDNKLKELFELKEQYRLFPNHQNESNS